MLTDITKLILKSPKRDAIFHKLKEDLVTYTPSFCVLWPISYRGGWCMQHQCRACYTIMKFSQCLGGIQEFGDLQNARIIGIETHMPTFDFFFFALTLIYSDNLSKNLQHENETISAAEGQLASKACPLIHLYIIMFKSLLHQLIALQKSCSSATLDWINSW